MEQPHREPDPGRADEPDRSRSERPDSDQPDREQSDPGQSADPGPTGDGGDRTVEGPQVVLVTGVSRALGAAFAKRIADDPDTSVIGVDLTPPQHDLGRAGYVRADIAGPQIAKVIAAHGVRTVVHLALVSGAGRSRSAAKEINVLGAMQLFAACQQSETVAKLVVQSSISVYGASPRDPARFTEDMSDSHQPSSGLGKDAVEVETYARGLARRRPDLVVTTVRLANLIGAGHHSQLTDYLTTPVVPRVMGFDARMQFLHPDDAIDALRLVTRTDVPGTFNIGAPDVITLSQALGMLGRPGVGVPRQSLPLVMPAVRRSGVLSFTADELDALTYGRVMDVARITAAAGFRTRWSSREAFAAFVASVPGGVLSAERVEAGVGGATAMIHDVAGRLRGVLGSRR